MDLKKIGILLIMVGIFLSVYFVDNKTYLVPALTVTIIGFCITLIGFLEEVKSKSSLSGEDYAQKRAEMNNNLEAELKENLPYLESREIKKIVIEFNREQDKMN